MKLKLSAILEKPERIFLVLGSFFGLISLFLMPALTIPDEGAHFWMSYGMFSKNQQIPRDLLISAEDSAKSIRNGTYIQSIFKDKVNFEGDSFQLNFTKGIVLNSANTDRPVSSLDISRLPQAIGIKLGQLIYPSVGVMTTMGRLCNFALFLAAIYFIIKKINYGKFALVFLALFPMIIQQAASLSYDVVNIVIVFAWVAFMINLSTQKHSITRKQLTMLTSLAIGLVATKPSNALLLAFLPFLPAALYKNTKLFVGMREKLPKFKLSRHSVKIIVGSVVLVGLAVLPFIVDAVLEKHGISTAKFVGVLFNTFFRTDINTQLDPIVTTGIVGHFGWLWYKLPEWLVIIHLSIFGLILLGDKVPRVSLRFAVISGLLLVISVLSITVGMYFLWTLRPNVAGTEAFYIQGMQGRYFTPLLVLLLPVFAYIQQYVSIKAQPKLIGAIAASMAAFSLTAYLVLTYIFFFLSSQLV